MQIEIDFDVFKGITIRRETEAQTPNDVLRALLGLPAAMAESRGMQGPATPTDGVIAAGRQLPDGTQLKTLYKGKPYSAQIRNGRIVSDGGKTFNSLSAAAFSITGSNVNGLRFWKARRPGDAEWATVATLPVSAS